MMPGLPRIAMRHSHSKLLAVAAALALGACQPRAEAALPEDVQRDLQAASAASLELAPSGSGTAVVSAVEQGRAPRAGAPARRAERLSAPTAAAAAPTIEAAPPAEPQSTATTGAPAPRPTPVQPVTTQRRGRQKTVSEVIRDAPFPILP